VPDDTADKVVVTSDTQDRFCVVIAGLGAVCCMASLLAWLAFIFKWQAVATVLTELTGSGVALQVLGPLVFLPLTVAYALNISPHVVFTEKSISGIVGRQTIDLAEITRWEFRKNILVLWPAPERVSRRGYFDRIVHPDIPGLALPANIMWAFLDPGKRADVDDFLTEHLGPSGTDLPAR